MKYFVISDLHGDFEAYSELIKYWDKKEQKLVFIGDLISRGPSGLLLLNEAMKLVKSGDAIFIKGNHEEMLSEFFFEPTIYKSYLSGKVDGDSTLENFKEELVSKGYEKSLLNNNSEFTNAVNSEFEELVLFLEGIPVIYVDQNLMFVHAAINNDAEQIRDLDKYTIIHGEENFHLHEHKLPHIVIFGHTPTQNLGADGDVFISKCKKKIGIDGGGFLQTENSSVNAIIIDSNEPTCFEVIRVFSDGSTHKYKRTL